MIEIKAGRPGKDEVRGIGKPEHKEKQMPVDSIIVIACVVSVFAFFAAVLTYADMTA